MHDECILDVSSSSGFGEPLESGIHLNTRQGLFMAPTRKGYLGLSKGVYEWKLCELSWFQGTSDLSWSLGLGVYNSETN